jgi:lysozyme
MNKTRIGIASLMLSALGMIGIANHEQFVGHTYKDAVGVNTIGYGTTAGVKPGQTITPERALIRLGQDIGQFEKGIKACLPVDLPLHQYEWDAYVSLAYNIGTGAFCRSSIVRKLKQDPSDYAGACESILLFNKAGGKVLKGLVVRRQAEYKLCKGEK